MSTAQIDCCWVDLSCEYPGCGITTCPKESFQAKSDIVCTSEVDAKVLAVKISHVSSQSLNGVGGLGRRCEAKYQMVATPTREMEGRLMSG